MLPAASIEKLVSIVRERHNTDGTQGLEAFKPFENGDNCGRPAVICVAETTIDVKRRFIVGTSRVKVQALKDLQKALNDARRRQFTYEESEEMLKKLRFNRERVEELNQKGFFSEGSTLSESHILTAL